MKKLMTLMLGMMFVLGTTTVFAQEKGTTKSTEKKSKGKGGKKKSTEKKTEEKSK